MSQEKLDHKQADLVTDKTLVGEPPIQNEDTGAGASSSPGVSSDLSSGLSSGLGSGLSPGLSPGLSYGAAVSAGSGAEQLIGTVLDGKILIESLIGQGGMSIVYLGRHLVLNRRVAIKVILPGLGFNELAVQRLQQEAKAAYSLNHENLASVRDVATTAGGLPYLVMDFAAGETLADMLRRGPITPPKAVALFKQVCAGLRAAHANGVIHRDLKPSNIMVEHRPDDIEMVKIVDFGIAKKVTEDADEIHKLTQTGEIFGTPLYMSPEQCRGEKLDQRSDIYSLGCVLYEVLTGKPPFKGQSPIATIMLHLEQDAPTPSEQLGIPSALVGIVHKCLEKKPQDRYQSMDDLYEELVSIEEGRGTRRPNPKKRQARPVSRLMLFGVSLGTLGFIFVINHFYKETVLQLQKREYGYQSIKSCNEILRLDPKDAKAYLGRADLRRRLNDQEGARADYLQAIKLDSNCAEAYIALSRLELAAKNYALSIQYANMYSDLRPNSIDGLRMASSIWMHQGKYQEALAADKLWLAKSPQDYDGLIDSAICLDSLNLSDQAIDVCSKIIALYPQKTEAYIRRAHSYYVKHDYNKALEDLSHSIAIKPSVAAYTIRAYVYCELKENDKAMKDVETALARDPARERTLITKAHVLFKIGKTSEAMELCNKLIAANAHSPSLFKVKAELMAALGKDNPHEPAAAQGASP